MFIENQPEYYATTDWKKRVKIKKKSTEKIIIQKDTRPPMFTVALDMETT